MAFYKSQYTGTDIDKRLGQGTYDDAVKAGFKGTKDEFDKLLGQLKQISDKALDAISGESNDLHTVNKDIIGAINEIHDELESKPDEQDVIDQGELEVFKDEIAAKYATKGEFNETIKDLDSKISVVNTNLVDSVNNINANVQTGFATINKALEETNNTLVAEIDQRKEAIKEVREESESNLTDVKTELSKNIETVNNNLIQSVNTINKNVADGFNTINGAIADEIRPNIETNKTGIKQLQETVATLNTNLYQSVKTINTTLNNAINTINGGIATEIAERQAADTELDNKLTQEISDRTQAIVSLDSTLRNEISQRKNADTTLDGMIRQEISNRQTADTELSDRIDVLEGAGYQTADQINTAINSKIEELVGAAPETLDTLKEIGDALNNDPDFAATITVELSKKLDSDKLLSGAGINVREEDGKKIVDISNDTLTKIQYADNEVRRLEQDKIAYAYDEKTQSNINVILPEGGSYLGNYGDENATVAKAAVYDGTKQLEIGSSKIHTNINTSDNLTIETSAGKKIVATVDQIPDVFETKGLTELETGESSTNIEAALGIDFASLIEIIRENKTVIIDRNSAGDYKTCIHASGNISSGNGAANLMFFIGTTPTIYQVQYVNGTFALAVDEYEFAKKSDISNLATKEEIPDVSEYATIDSLNFKVDKVDGKGLSTEDYTTEEKTKLAGLENYDDTELLTQLQQTEAGVAENLASIEKLKSEKQNIQDETLETSDKTVVGAINEILELLPTYINIPIRSLKDQIYTQETILGWFGVTDIVGLKNLFNGRRLIVLRYGILLTGNPMYYKIPIQYSSFESANQIKLIAIGLDTSNDVVSKYTITCNLDGTVIEGNSNVKLELISLE